MKLSREDEKPIVGPSKKNQLLHLKSHSQEAYINLSQVTKCEIADHRLRFLSEKYVVDIDLANAPDLRIKEKLLDAYIQGSTKNVEQQSVIPFRDKLSDDYLSTRVIFAFTHGNNSLKVHTAEEVLYYNTLPDQFQKILSENYDIVYKAQVGLFKMMKVQR